MSLLQHFPFFTINQFDKQNILQRAFFSKKKRTRKTNSIHGSICKGIKKRANKKRRKKVS